MATSSTRESMASLDSPAIAALSQVRVTVGLCDAELDPASGADSFNAGPDRRVRQ